MRAHSLSPDVTAAYQAASAVVASLLLDLIPLDLLRENLLGAALWKHPPLPAGQRPMQASERHHLDALIVREMAKGAALWLLLGAPSRLTAATASALMPQGTAAVWLPSSLALVVDDPRDAHQLSCAASLRWNAARSIVEEPLWWSLVSKLANVLLVREASAAHEAEQALCEPALAVQRRAHAAALRDVMTNWRLP